MPVFASEWPVLASKKLFINGLFFAELVQVFQFVEAKV
jgi:hypothetical protein